MAADGIENEEIARRSGLDSDTVRRWRTRFKEQGTAGIGVIAKGRGRKPSLPPGTVAKVLRLTLHELPRGRLDPVEYPVDGGPGRDRQGRRGADLDRPQPQAMLRVPLREFPLPRPVGSCLS